MKKHKKNCVFVFNHREGKNLLILFGNHMFPSGDTKKISITSWCLVKKLILGSAVLGSQAAFSSHHFVKEFCVHGFLQAFYLPLWIMAAPSSAKGFPFDE